MTPAAGRGAPAPAWKCDNGYVGSSTEPGDARKAGGEVTTSARCTYGGGLLRRGCGQAAVTDCVYCARPFCEEHGQRGAQYMDVCSRTRCQRKREDLDAHTEWRARMELSNRVSVCADERCDSRMRHECSRCRLLFCADHVREMRGRDSSRQRPAGIKALVCAHCGERRKIWT